MHRLRTSPVALVFVASAAACGPNPLVGQWRTSSTSGSVVITNTTTLAADGTYSSMIVGSGSCSGTQTIGGLTWSSAGDQITFSGSATCSGTITCVDSGNTIVIDCGGTGANAPNMGACQWSISPDDNALTISHCSGSVGTSATYARVGM